jgi:DNA-nicking Smr family endonuclease
MARRRKTGRGHPSEPDVGNAAKAPVKATTSLGPLLKAAGHAKVSVRVSGPPPTLPPPGPQSRIPVPAPARRSSFSTGAQAPSPVAELRMLNDAYEGARPLQRKAGRAPEPRPAAQRQWIQADREQEAAARARLAALVGGGVRFRIVRQDEFVQGHRSDASAKLVARLTAKAFTPEATLDLHGQRMAAVPDLIANFVRTHQRRGARSLLIIAGKGLHSEGGVGVLRDAAVEALTQGLAAPLVAAFSSAHESRGGSGALSILLG